jgi:hypothetical protein
MTVQQVLSAQAAPVIRRTSSTWSVWPVLPGWLLVAAESSSLHLALACDSTGTVASPWPFHTLIASRINYAQTQPLRRDTLDGDRMDPTDHSTGFRPQKAGQESIISTTFIMPSPQEANNALLRFRLAILRTKRILGPNLAEVRLDYAPGIGHKKREHGRAKHCYRKPHGGRHPLVARAQACPVCPS